jgi:hypothetical protein
VLVMLAAELVLWQSGLQLWGLLAGLQLFFIGFNVMEALLPSLISKESPPGYKGTAMGVYSTSQFLGVAIGGSLGGLLYSLGAAPGVWRLRRAGPGLARGQPHHGRAPLCEQPAHRAAGRGGGRRPGAEDPRLRGVSDVLLVREERSLYVKVDSKRLTRSDLERLVDGWLRGRRRAGLMGGCYAEILTHRRNL